MPQVAQEAAARAIVRAGFAHVEGLTESEAGPLTMTLLSFAVVEPPRAASRAATASASTQPRGIEKRDRGWSRPTPCGGVPPSLALGFPRPGRRLLALAFLELDQWNAVAFREALDLRDLRLPDLPEGGRGWETESSLPPKKAAYLSHRLEPGDISLQEDSIERADLEGHVIPLRFAPAVRYRTSSRRLRPWRAAEQPERRRPEEAASAVARCGPVRTRRPGSPCRCDHPPESYLARWRHGAGVGA